MTELSQLVAASPVRWQTATITAIELNTPRVSSFWFRPAEPFAFKAGQHVDIRLTASDGYRAQRSYSIASAPENPEAQHHVFPENRAQRHPSQAARPERGRRLRIHRAQWRKC